MGLPVNLETERYRLECYENGLNTKFDITRLSDSRFESQNLLGGWYRFFDSMCMMTPHDHNFIDMICDGVFDPIVSK